MERRDKINYYLDLAEMVAQRGTCLRRHYGAVIVSNDNAVDDLTTDQVRAIYMGEITDWSEVNG